MKINRFYEQKHAPPGIDPYIFEKALGEVLEPRAKDAFEKVIRQSRDVTAEDTAAILCYLELQRTRVPRQAETAKQIALDAAHILLLNGPPEVASAIAEQKVKIAINDSFRFEFMRIMTKAFSPHFARMRWHIVMAEEGQSFITSDSPVTFWNADFPPPYEPGLALAGTMVFFPLDSHHLFWLCHPEFLDDPAISRSAKVPEAKLEEEGLIGITYIIWNEKQVCDLNWAMIESSNRIVVGNNREIIEKAIETGYRGACWETNLVIG